MPNMNLKKTPMPEQDPNVRNKNYKEVSAGYTDEMAQEEAKRCLQCKNKPCMKGCPVNVSIPNFIKEVTSGNLESAYEIIKETNSLPAICGRVCPQENQCESKCVRGIKGESVAIGRLERYVADYHFKLNNKNNEKIEKNGYKIAVIGSGPSGLTCAGDLAKMGYDVTIFEALHTTGGVLVYGIPEFRLPKEIVKKEIDELKSLGVNIETNMVIGKVLSIDDLLEMDYKAVFIGSGAGLPKFMNIKGESLVGVYSANEFLTRINLMKAYKEEYDTPILNVKNVAVIGGGNVAMDAARCAKRLGAENVYILYRRSEDEMPARSEEIHHAQEEGIIFKVLSNPIEIVGDENGRVNNIKCIKMELGEPDASGRRRPVEIPDSTFNLNVDCVIMAIGNSPNPLITTTTEGLKTNNRGCLIVDDTLMTTKKGIFAGGDTVTGAATVILAMGAGKAAAKSIDKYIQSNY